MTAPAAAPANTSPKTFAAFVLSREDVRRLLVFLRVFLPVVLVARRRAPPPLEPLWGWVFRVVFLLLFFAPVYVPLDLLSGWIETVATFNPVTYFLEAGRSLIAGDPTEVALAFGVALALMSVLAVWGIRGLHRAEAAG